MIIRFRFLPFLAVLLCCFGVAVAQEKPLATFGATGTSRMLGQGSGNLGFRFVAAAPFTVSALGYYDDGGNSLSSAHLVALFDAKGQEIENSRASVGPNAPLEKDGFRYVAIAPLALEAGTYSVSAFAGAGKTADNSFRRNVTALKLAGGFTFAGGVFDYAPGFGLGAQLQAENNFFGPNLKVAQGREADSKTIKVACIGDSITFGSGVADRARDSYPAVLQRLLGASYLVGNFGVGGATLLQKGDKPYTAQAQFKSSDDFAPDIVVIMLGTNDAKPKNWENKADFAANYRELIAHYATLASHPRVFVALSPPVYGAGAFNISPPVLENEIVPLIAAVGGATIDVRGALSNHAEWFPDTVHPAKEGANAIAQAVFQALQP